MAKNISYANGKSSSTSEKTTMVLHWPNCYQLFFQRKFSHILQIVSNLWKFFFADKPIISLSIRLSQFFQYATPYLNSHFHSQIIDVLLKKDGHPVKFVKFNNVTFNLCYNAFWLDFQDMWITVPNYTQLHMIKLGSLFKVKFWRDFS